MIIDLDSVKELWSITAKHGTVQNKIYGFSGSFNKPYDSNDAPKLCIFSIIDTDNKRETGYIFSNAFDDAHSWERIRDYIGGGHRKHLAYIDRQSTVKNMILSLYSGQPIGTKYGRSKIIMGKPRYTMEDGTEIYDLRIGNLYLSTDRVPVYSNGYLASDGKNIIAHFNGKSFFTEYDPLLYAGLCSSVTKWKLNFGTREQEKRNDNPMLICMVSDYTKEIAIAFAEIVYQYHHNVNGLSLIDPRKDEIGFAQRLIQNHKDMMDIGLVCDHLTENRSNNYSWALAMVPIGLNTTLGKRIAVAYPYYFYTIWNKESFCYRVKFGIDDGMCCWEQRYSILNLCEQTNNGQYLYKKMFSTFLKRIDSQHVIEGKETYLSHWGKPEHAYDADNPLNIMQKDFDETYPFSDGDIAKISSP